MGIVRNSWGKSWGYGGYFKITRSKNCHITDLGWLPQVYKGKVPDPNDKPEPEPASDCVKLYGRGGFRRHPMMEASLELNFLKIPQQESLLESWYSLGIIAMELG